MNKDKALDLALEALRSAAAELYRASSYCNTYEVLGNTNDAITVIKKARSAPVQEPVAWRLWDDEPGQPPRWQYYDKSDFKDGVNPMETFPQLAPLYTTPPAAQRPFVGLTDEEAFQICVDCGCLSEDWLTLLDAIEAKLKEKNT